MEGRRSLKLEIPKLLQDDDLRGAYRVERVGRVEVTFSTPHFQLRSGALTNLSTTGAQIHASQDHLESLFQTGDLMTVTIPLEPELKINSPALVRWAQGRSLGLEFLPILPEAMLTPLSRWIFQRREEDKDRVKGLTPLSPLPPTEGGGLVLVSSSPELEQALRDYLVGLPSLRRIPPTLATVKEAAMGHPALVLFHLASLSLDDRKRLRALVEVLPARMPFLLLGSDLEASALMGLGTELKAAAAYVLGPKPSPFFQRLLQGILRRQDEGFEGILAPREPA